MTWVPFIGVAISTARKAKGLTQRELGALVVPPTTREQISTLENGVTLEVEDLPLVLPGQINLFGEPPLLPSLSQWPTPHFLARLLTRWVQPGERVLEPSCGGGNLIAALLERGHDPKLITGVEIDPAWVEHARARFDGSVRIALGDFLDPLQTNFAPKSFDVVLMNSPFEDGIHGRFIERALQVAETVIGIFPVAVEFTAERNRGLWKNVAQVVRRARLPERVKYAGTDSPKFDTIALEIVRRLRPRADDGRDVVIEEVWWQP